MSPDARAHHALRHTVALSPRDHVSCLRVRGDAAMDLIDRVCPAELYIREGQMLHTLLLDDKGHPFVDLYVCCAEEDDLLLLAEGAAPDEVQRYLCDHGEPGQHAAISDLSADRAMIALSGPYAWEVLAELVGQEVIGLPYLSFFEQQGMFCFRAGKTGEYGYELLVPRADLDALRGRLLELGAAFEMRAVDRAAVEQCALENFVFNIWREGRAGLTPIELQLQWRLSRDKQHPGAAALAEQRRQGVGTRLTMIVGDDRIALGDELRDGEGAPVGKVVNAGYSVTRGDWVALAALAPGCAHPGIDAYRVTRAEGPVPVRTISAPALRNRSLFVDPRRHSSHTRGEDRFPALVARDPRVAPQEAA